MKRNALGQFIAGQSGNVNGRPKDPERISALARTFSLEAVETLADLMRTAKDERVRGTAAQALLDRGWGKPRMSVSTEREGSSCVSALRAISADLLDKKSSRHACEQD